MESGSAVTKRSHMTTTTGARMFDDCAASGDCRSHLDCDRSGA